MKTITWMSGRMPIVAAAMTAIAVISVAAHDAEAQQSAPTSDIVIVNNDGPNEGLNDLTPVPPVAGNTARTLGAQRLAVFEAAAEVWENILVSDVPIEVQAQFDPLPCTSNAGTLGQAGPLNLAADFPGAQVPNTIYVIAQANQQAGVDLDEGRPDINATFNSDVGQVNCISGGGFFLGLNGQPAPAGTFDFLEIVLHEMAHGLGFLSLVNLQTGEKLANLDDIFSNNLEDQLRGRSWPVLTNAERIASSTNNLLRWTGEDARACAAQVLQLGAAGDGDVRMFSPNPVQPGSSVSHFDVSLTPDDLMEPFATDETSFLDVTTAAFSDMGWPISLVARQQLCQPRQVSRGTH